MSLGEILITAAVLIGGTIAIILFIRYTKKEHKRVFQEFVDGTLEWEDRPRINMTRFVVGCCILFLVGSPIIILMIRQSMDVSLIEVVIINCSIWFGVLFVFIYIFSMELGIDYASRWRRFTAPLNIVVQAIDVSLDHRGIRFRRFNPDEYSLEGSSKRVRKSLGLFRWLLSTTLIYDLYDPKGAVYVSVQVYKGVSRTDVVIYCNEVKEGSIIDGLIKDIDWHADRI